MSNKEVDRISLLPDCLLHDILSLLNTKQVVQTCVLSKRWNTLWTDIPTLNYDFGSYPFEDYSNDTSIFPDYFLYYLGFKEISFKDFIFRLLSKHRSEYIQTLSYSSTGYYEDQDFMKEFFSHAQCLKAQQLYFTTCKVDESMWLCLSACQLVTALNISCSHVADLESLMLHSLRTLVIKKVCDFKLWDDGQGNEWRSSRYYDEDDIELSENTLSGCPNLECFVLTDCLSESACVVSAQKLENLEFNHSPNYGLKFPKVELRTPNLKSVKFKNVIPCVKSASEFLCIDKVCIAVYGNHSQPKIRMEENISKLLRVFRNANSFTLPLSATQVLFKAPSLRGCCFRNLRHLKFKSEWVKETIELPIGANTMSNFIECPNLQTYSVGSRNITKSLSQLNLLEKF